MTHLQELSTGTENAPTATPERATEHDQPCHILDDAGRPLCGATLAPGRRVHDVAECIAADHARCVVCDHMDGAMILTSDGKDWLR